MVPGTKLIVENVADGVLLKPAPMFAASTIEDVCGSPKRAGAALSLEDMDAAIAREAKRRARD